MNQENQINYLEKILDSFIDQPKFAGMSETEKNEFKLALIQNYNDRITSLIILNMPENKSTEFTEIAETGDAQKTQEFIYANIPYFDKLVEDESRAFLEALIATNQLPKIMGEENKVE